MITRRAFVSSAVCATVSTAFGLPRLQAAATRAIATPRDGEDIFRYLKRAHGKFNVADYARILGAGNAFKEGDEIIGVAAADETSRSNARALLSRTSLDDINRHPVHRDQLFEFISPEGSVSGPNSPGTVGQLKRFLLESDEVRIKSLMPALSSDVIACVVKLMSNAELIAVGRKVFNPLPGSQIGARGYLGARIQPNSPTDNIDDIRWQVFDGWSYAVGDVLLGTNPVSSTPQSVAAVEAALQDLLQTFGITNLMPHCVLSHIDVQAQVEQESPGSTELWFQSIAGTDSANATFDIDIDKMRRHARQRSGRFGLYFETGQGADFTNGHAHGFDMVMHESRKYGFARALSREVATARRNAGRDPEPWVHLNDVAGFIGPEVFRTREQLVRCCLEDIVMGKLHGLCLGLDVCSTLHMDISLDDLDWCLDQIMPANPAYLMALPTKIDPMLGYLTTGFQDHVRLREKFGFRVNDGMWQFFQKLGVIDAHGKPTEHFGDPAWVYLQYQRLKGDERSEQQITTEARQQIEAVRGRGVFIAQGHGRRPWDLAPQLHADTHRIYDDAKASIWTELTPDFIRTIPGVDQLTTTSRDREDYILHPESGEKLTASSVRRLRSLRTEQAGEVDAQIVISDGLNALSIMDDGHLQPFLDRLHSLMNESGFRTSPTHLLQTSGRVRAGYRIGEQLFGGLQGHRAILHVIGERPGSGHHTFSTYITAPTGDVWGAAGKVDHNITKVVSGAAITALNPVQAAEQVVTLLKTLV